MPKFRDIQQISLAGYECDISWSYLEDWLAGHGDMDINLDPDYQRGHVWYLPQQIAYIEHILRGGTGGKDIYWNCPGWRKDWKGPLELVDGKQRITAVLKFLHNKIPAFRHYYEEYEDSLHLLTARFRFYINDLTKRKDILQWYLDLNSGVAHTSEELDRVRKILQKEEMEYYLFSRD
jgi:hypothetical protein